MSGMWSVLFLLRRARRIFRLEQGEYVVASYTRDRKLLGPALFARHNSNSGERDRQPLRQKPAQGFVGAIFDRRGGEAHFQCSSVFAFDGLAAGARGNAHRKGNDSLRLFDFHPRRYVASPPRFATGRAPNSAVPGRISVAPSSIAISKSWLMPMDRIGSGLAMRRETFSRSSASLRKNGRTASGCSKNGGMVISPRNCRFGKVLTLSASAGRSASETPLLVASSLR